MTLKNWLLYTLNFTFIIGCSIDITVTDKTTGSGSIDFSEESQFEFDDRYVEIKNGEIRLKTVDLEHSEEEFKKGSFVGTELQSSNRLSLITNNSSDSTRVDLNFPNKVNDLIGYWRFEGNTLDSSGKNNSVSFQNNVLTNGDGRIESNSAVFNGTDSEITFLNPTGAPSEFTVSFWLNPSTCTNTNNAVYGANNWGSFVFHTNVNCSIFVGTNLSSRIDSSEIPNNTLELNKWQMYLFTYDGTTGSLYKNGGLLAQKAMDPPLAWGGFKLGAPDSNTISGSIDEVAIWTQKFSSEEVLRLYNIQTANFTELSDTWTPKWNKLIGYWKMYGNWQDSSGKGNHGLATGAPIFENDRKVGSHSAKFNGSSNFVNIDNNNFDGLDSISFAAWVKVDALDGIERTFFEKISASYSLRKTATERWRLTVKNASNTSVSVTSVQAVKAQSWTHLAGTYDGQRIRFYVDGKLVGSAAQTGSIWFDGSDLILGCNGNISDSCAGDHFPGNIDEVSIWGSVALSNSEIFQIYNRQKQKYASHFDSEVIDFGSLNSTWPDLSWITSLPFGKELVGDFDNDGDADSEDSTVYSDLNGDLGSNLVGYWAFNEATMNSVSGDDFEDRSGHGIHGVEAGGISIVAGVSGNAIQFDGIDDQVSFSDNLLPGGSQARTISIWFKFSEDTSVRIFDYGTESFGQRTTIQYISGGSKYLALAFSGHSFGFDWIPDGEWHHFVGVFPEGSTSTDEWVAYFDGAVKPLVTKGGTPRTMNTVLSGTGYLGRTLDGSVFFQGTADEVALWDRELTSSEILQLYRRHANRLKMQVKSCVDSSCHCKSYSTSPSGSNSDCDGDGVVNAEDDNDIHLAKFQGPGGDGLTYFSELLNRDITNVTFDCDANTTDSHSDICAEDEILLAGNSKPSSPLFTFDDFIAKPQANRYFQYRVIMEADENTACNGEPCLPELTSVNLNPSGEQKYFGKMQTVTFKKPIPYIHIQSASLEAENCVSFQLSPDGTQYYTWSENSWRSPSSETESTFPKELTENIKAFSQQFGPGNLYLRAFLSSDDGMTSCSFRAFKIQTSEISAN